MIRNAGILLPISSLPSKYGIGCFSQSAFDFVDWLEEAGQTYWQILPLGSSDHKNSWDSPYQSYSAFAGNPYFISLETMIEEGLLTEEECSGIDFGNRADKIDYEKLYESRLDLLHKAYERSNITFNAEYQKFIQQNHWWLEDYALFMAVKAFFDGAEWTQWPEDIRMHWGFALDYYRRTLYFDVEFQKFLQYQFWTQWLRLKKYANTHHIRIVGDIPIYVSLDSADVWSHPELFQLDENNRPLQVAGCPPDDFAPDGQLWGNPLYRWDYLENTGFEWWVTRLWYSFEQFDAVRIDHFRGFDEYYAIAAEDTTARNGHWEKGPGMKLFHTIQERIGVKSVIAEDLGFRTDSVRRMVEECGFPNMKVLEFAFHASDQYGFNEYLPHNFQSNCVVYTGTHDNETISGWFQSQDTDTKRYIREYLDDFKTPDKKIPAKLINLAMASCSKTCIIPIQDYLMLGNEARINHPGTVGDNWCWRLGPLQLGNELAQSVKKLTMRYGRMNEEIRTAQEAELSQMP